MNIANVVQYALFLLILTAFTKPFGLYMERVFEGKTTWLDPLMGPLERGLYRFMGVHPEHKMGWALYLQSFLAFSLVGTLGLYGFLRLQGFLPGGPDAKFLPTPMTPDLAMNTAISFATTTTWQAYGGETTMRYATQMVGLIAQNFLAGAAGLAVGIAFMRGLARQGADSLGNFWFDLTRSLLWVLLPLSVVGSLFLVWQGVPQNFSSYATVTTLEGATQSIAQGPVAALEFIKNLGTNGGGFFNVNGAHPYENPTPSTNFVEMLAIVLLPASLTYTFGKMVGNARQGWMLFGAMMFLFVTGLVVCDRAEQSVHPQIFAQNVTGGNMEGKEARFGVGGSVLAVVTTSNGATGSYNSMHDSLTPIGGLVPLVNMLLGEIAFGGLGTGLYSMVMVALVGVFMAGLMIGRTPEYLGKKLGPRELKMLMLYTLAGPTVVLLLTALAISIPGGLAGLTTNEGIHGFSEIFVAYASSAANNGQNFAGLSANTPFYNITTAIAMMIGRFGLAIPALAFAGLVARQTRGPVTSATLPTDTWTFGCVVVATALLVGGLSFFPALALGPIAEHFMMR